MRRYLVLVLLLFGFALAAPLAEIRIEGADPVLTALARVALPVEPGQDTASIDLEAVRAALMDSGYFRKVEVALEGDVLRVRLEPNPPIAGVEVKAEAFPPEELAQLLGDELALGPGATYNPVRAREGADRLASFYRERGFPFAPEVAVETREGEDGVQLIYTVKETPPLKKLELKGATVFPESELRAAFKPLLDHGSFAWDLYRAAVEQVNRRYFDAGYRFSGVDTRRSRLEDGVLTVFVRELKVVEVDASALDGVQPQVPLGKVLNYDRLLDEIARLSRQLEREIKLQLEPVGSDGVRVVLTPGAVRYGKIREVRIEGATALGPETLKPLLRLQPGDLFSPELAQEDFLRIQKAYREAGYEIRAQPDFAFKDGVYLQKVHELRIEGYRLEWQGAHSTKDFVILRELPRPGELFSVPAIRKGISNLLRSGLLAEPPAVSTAPGAAPDRVVLVLGLKEAKSTVLAPAVAWSSIEGWSGQATLESKNLWGRAHQASLNLVFGENDAGDNLTLRASYNIPWLWLDALDFQQVPTSLSLSVYTYPQGNLPLEDANGNDTGWQYTERRSGGKFSIGRPWSGELENLKVFANLDAEWVYPKLEIYDPNKPSTPDETTARSLLPIPYQSYSIGASATYSTVENPQFPSQGFTLTGSLAYGLNLPYGGSLSQFVPGWVNFKTYTVVEGDPRQVFALRASAGAVLGDPPASRVFFLGGNQTEITTLRGYNPMELSGRYLLGSSLEYRYDFNLQTTISQTVIGILFVDVGSVWNPGEALDLKTGFGAGVQLNLGYGSVLLPALRFDYGFSAAHPSGVFHFRIGPVF
ncbi:BamA/OMP85 family outer membrane protein [Oceanithermus desulfurans]